ncbi:MAG: diguanylate cyclase [Alphaproteobacteria bacterium]|nr:diguanylate cyclase [Alphaproteobacteria bacterium]
MDAKAKVMPLSPHQADERVPSILIDTFAEANTGVAIFDAAGATLYVNAEMQALADKFVGEVSTLGDLMPEDRTSAAYIDFERFRVGRLAILRSRYAIRCVDGSLLWADVSARRLAGDGIAAPLIVVQIVDITAEQDSRRNEVLWEAALGAARQGVWDHDARRGTVTYSRMWRRMRGMSENEEVDGRREVWLERLHPDDRKRIESVVDRQESGEDGFDVIEYRERHRDGHYIWIYSRGKPIEWDENGVPVRTVGTDTDITRIKMMEAELALEKERLSVTLQSIADGVISTDHDGRITFINKAAELMTGWNVDAALGEHIETVFDSRPENQPDRPANLTAQCLKAGQIFRATFYTRLKARNGRTRYVREIASPVLDDAGAAIGAVLVFRDSTHRRKLMRELEYTASHDPLTGLDNRAAFERHLEASLGSAIAGEDQHALCLVDLDHFKAVNDGAGHSAGDALLKEIAKLIRATCRSSDCVARLGGDEFGIVLNDVSLKEARKLAQKIGARIAGLKFTWQDESFISGASIGITAIDGSVQTAGELYRNADNACYSAKRNGRGCVVVYG